MKYLIIDATRGMFWKSNNHGYTEDINEARQFTEEEAMEKVNAPNVNDLIPIRYKDGSGKLVVAVKKVGEQGNATKMIDTLENFQEVVGGYIQEFRLTDEIMLILNEEGKLMGLPHNFSIPCHGGLFEDIVGDVALVRYNQGGEYESLTIEDLIFLKEIGLL